MNHADVLRMVAEAPSANRGESKDAHYTAITHRAQVTVFLVSCDAVRIDHQRLHCWPKIVLTAASLAMWAMHHPL